MGILDILGTNKDGGSAGIGGLLSGIGSLAGAWGQYNSNKKQNEMIKAQFNYEKQKDALANARATEDRQALKDAFATPTKKKKNADGTDVADPYALNTFLGA
jgi:hypothetical protein